MKKCQFKHVSVIGYGVVTGEVLETVHILADKYGYTEEYVEYEVHPFNAAKKYAKAEDIALYVIVNENDLTEHFEKMLGSRTLIISASNNYLFPTNIVSNSNVTIINFHNALLPELPGRNAPSWAIYEGKKHTGITWHYVTEGVDAGDIIIQKKCDIGEDIRAYELVAKQMQMAAEAFNECYESVLTGSAQVSKQSISDNRRLYKSYEIPGEGVFDLTDSPVDIYRLLRAMDYGKNDIFPLPKSMLGGQTIQIRRYKKISTADVEERKDRIYLPLDENYSLMLRYDTVDASGEMVEGV